MPLKLQNFVYNLRSDRHETLQLPVKLQMSDDTRFLLGSSGQRQSFKYQFCDSESSVTETETLITSSDTEHKTVNQKLSEKNLIQIRLCHRLKVAFRFRINCSRCTKVKMYWKPKRVRKIWILQNLITH